MSNSVQQTSAATLESRIEAKFAELSELISEQQFGPDGPPKNITFREIEQAGYRIAQQVSAQFQQAATRQHQKHFEATQPCPQCGAHCETKGMAERQLLTRLGPVSLTEIKFHCNACRRSFFPSA